jgi:hypothetical protein
LRRAIVVFHLTQTIFVSSYIRHLKTFPKYADLTEDEILQQVESDPHTLRQRTKEILKGKMSESYAVYTAKYPIKYVLRFMFTIVKQCIV